MKLQRTLPKYITIFLVLVILSVTFLMQGQVEPVAAAGANYTTGSGKIYKNGQEIYLNGLNWFGFEESGQLRPGGTWTDVKWTDMLDQMQNLGFNAIRVPVCPATLGSNSVGYISNVNTELINKNSRQVLNTFLNELNSRGIYILLDHHRPECTEITPLWYTDNYSEQDWINDLVELADSYKNLEYFMGIDLSNEPYGSTWGAGNSATDWNKAAERAGAAIREVNTNILIFVEGVGGGDGNSSCGYDENPFWGENLTVVECVPIDPAKIPANKLVLSPHVYGPSVFAQSYFSAGNFPNNMAAIWEDHWGYLIDQGYTLAIGEWGGKYTGSDKTWQDAFVDYLVSKGICHSFHWSWNPNSGDTGGIVQGDWQTVESGKYSNIKRLFDTCSTGSGGGSSSSQTSSATSTNNSTTSSATTSAGTQSPFGGSPLTLPGRLEAEDFDEGGQGIAYSDNDVQNVEGTTYRQGGVDIADYGSGRYVVGYTEVDEWLEYTVNFSQSGVYRLTAYAVTADSGSRSFGVLVDGVNKGEVTVPVQSSWNDFVEVELNDVDLSAGEHIIRLDFIDSGINLDYIDFELVSTSSSSAAVNCVADYNEDKIVDALDLGVFAANYKTSGIDSSLDLVGDDSYLDSADFSKLAEVYGGCTSEE